MKKATLSVLGVVFLALVITGCHKKETAEVPGSQPVVMEQTAGAPTANAPIVEAAVSQADSSIQAASTAVETAASAVTEATQSAVEQAAAVIEKPTPQQIQQALKNAGLYNGKVDGEIGPKTKRAIEAFQSQNGLTADGKVGAKTWSKLGSHLSGASAVATEPVMPADASATGTTTQAVSN